MKMRVRGVPLGGVPYGGQVDGGRSYHLILNGKFLYHRNILRDIP